MSPILCRIGQCPKSDSLAGELLDRILVALIIDLEVDLLFHGEGLGWLQDCLISAHQRARFGLLSLYGIGRLMVHNPGEVLLTADVHVETLTRIQLGELTTRYRSVW